MDGDFATKLQNVLSDPEAMSKILSIASSLGASGGNAESLPEPEPTESVPTAQPTPQSLSMPASTDPKIALLNSLKPLLREDRRDRIDALTRAMLMVSVMKNFKK